MFKELTSELKKELNEGMFDKIMSKFTPKRAMPAPEEDDQELPVPDLTLGKKPTKSKNNFIGAIPPEYSDYGLPGGEVSKSRIKSNKMSLARPNDITNNQTPGATVKDKTYPMSRSSIMQVNPLKNIETDTTNLHKKAFLPSVSAFEKTAPFSLETDEDLPIPDFSKTNLTPRKLDRETQGKFKIPTR